MADSSSGQRKQKMILERFVVPESTVGLETTKQQNHLMGLRPNK